MLRGPSGCLFSPKDAIFRLTDPLPCFTKDTMHSHPGLVSPMANGPDTLVIMFSPASTCIESCLLRQGQCGLSISWSLEAVSSPLLPPILAFSLPAPSEDRALCAHHLHSCAERPADARAGTRVVPPGPASSAVPPPLPILPTEACAGHTGSPGVCDGAPGGQLLSLCLLFVPFLSCIHSVNVY